MVKRILKSGLVALTGVGLMASAAQALNLQVIDVTDDDADGLAAVQAWMGLFGGGYTVLESFDDEAVTGGVTEITTKVDGTGTDFGTFKLGDGALAGQGSAAYDKTTPLFGIKDATYPGPHGRGDITGGGHYFESGDVTEITLDLVYQDFDNLFFYMMDPSDRGATTIVMADGESYTFPPGLGLNKGLYFFGITLDEGEVLSQLSWSTDGNPDDGWGVDKFGTAGAPVPEPATMLLFGAGLAGLAGVARRRKEA